ncbi:MAG: tryptophan synthase subunit alpha, partial [Coriobacteriales bacterium]|nr:tryptophan synthase subunit alpha [Coriobacteriales bacterium]
MSNCIARAFAQAPGGKAFIPFITAGDPTLEVTEQLVVAMAEAGADLIELGIPFSDPTAEGPVIQEANIRALRHKVTTDDVFDMVARVRERCDVPLVIMTYANVVYSYGIERFAKRQAELDMGGVILPDVPFEEKEEFSVPFAECGLDVVSLVAPTSHERIRMIASDAHGFVYIVSSLGVTGVRSEITTDIGAMVELIRSANPNLPCAVGFGISTPEQAARMAAISDGAIVGSALVRMIGELGEACVEPVAARVREMAAAVHGA